jgi:hypothetical protein
MPVATEKQRVSSSLSTETLPKTSASLLPPKPRRPHKGDLLPSLAYARAAPPTTQHLFQYPNQNRGTGTNAKRKTARTPHPVREAHVYVRKNPARLSKVPEKTTPPQIEPHTTGGSKMDPVSQVLDEIEQCSKCTEKPEGDEEGFYIEKCTAHKEKLREAQRIEEKRVDPQRNRIGVREDPTPDAEYGDPRR